LELYAKTHGHNHRCLNCLCGVSSYLVFLKLKELGYKPIFYMNSIHCFVMLGEYYIDLTIKQFDENAPEIYFEKTRYPNVNGWENIHRKRKKAITQVEMKKLFRDWPNDQNPFKVKKRLPVI